MGLLELGIDNLVRDKAQTLTQTLAIEFDLRERVVASVDRGTVQAIEPFKVVDARLQCLGVINFVGIAAKYVIDVWYCAFDYSLKLKHALELRRGCAGLLGLFGLG